MQENTIHEEKNQPIEKDPKIIQVMEWVDQKREVISVLSSLVMRFCLMWYVQLKLKCFKDVQKPGSPTVIFALSYDIFHLLLFLLAYWEFNLQQV